jgi:hypothetical protein
MNERVQATFTRTSKHDVLRCLIINQEKEGVNFNKGIVV